MPYRDQAVLASIVTLALAACGPSRGPTSDAGSIGEWSVNVEVSANALVPTRIVGEDGVVLDVPADATDATVTITVSLAPGARRPAGATVVSPTVRLGPEGTTFKAPLELTLPIEPASLPAGRTLDDVLVVRAPRDTDAYVPVPTRRSGNAVVASTEHFSDFVAIVVDTGATPFGTCTDGTCGPGETCATCPFDCGLCLAPPALSLVSSDPVDGALDVPIAAAVTLTFDRDVAPASASANVELTTMSTPVPGVVSVAGAVVTFTPDAALVHATDYVLTVGALTDLDGTAFAGATTSFRTVSAPAITAMAPVSGDTGVHPRVDVVFTVSGAPDPTTLDMQATDGPCSGSVQVSTDGFVNCYGGAVTNDTTSITARATASLPSLGNASARITASVTSIDGFPYGGATTNFRVSPTADFAYTIYLSPSVSPALGGPAGADATCMASAPTGVAAAKALLMSSTRHPCTAANCTDTASVLDWVMATATSYVRTDGTLLFTTDAGAPIFTGWPMAQGLGGTATYFMYGGNVGWTSTGLDCGNWSSTGGTMNTGYTGSTTNTFLNGGSASSCNTMLRLLCVEQVPGTLPGTH